MCLFSKVKDLREKLLQNCKYAIARLKAAKDMIEKGSSILQDSAKMTSTQAGILQDSAKMTSTQAAASYSNPEAGEHSFKVNDDPNIVGDKSDKFKDKIINDVYSVIHGVLIQEWEQFLYDILTEGVVYYVKGYDLAGIGQKFSLENFNPVLTIEEMREKISAELERGLLKYEPLFKESRSLFKIDESDLLTEMKKQVQIRHIFQHNQGKIRRLDLGAIGSNGPGACFNILDDEGKLQCYKEDEEIWLSLPEIQKLYETIEQYSEKFQMKAEMAQPIKATNSSVKKPEVIT